MYSARTTPDISASEKAHAQTSRSLAEECVVLLENDGTLPFNAGVQLALFGSGARETVKGGTGSGDVYSRSFISVEQGLKDAGFELLGTGWLDRYSATRSVHQAAYAEFIAEKARKLNTADLIASFTWPYKEIPPLEITPEDIAEAKADTAVYVIARNSGEGADRIYEPGDYLPFAEELENLEMLCANYPHVIVVLNIGGVMELTRIKAIKGISAIVLMSQLGSDGGSVIADVLLGRVVPSGKLTDTWAKSYCDYPSSATFSHNNGNIDDDNYTEGIYVGYRYFDTFGADPLYPFGFGRSYTDFVLETLSCKLDGETVRLRVAVCNTGERFAGKEVVQLYVSAPATALDKPYQELKAFAKTDLLQPGERQVLDIDVSVRDLASYCQARASWVLEQGRYVLRVGNSSRATAVAAVLELDETVCVAELKNLMVPTAAFEELKAPECPWDVGGAAPVVLRLSAKTIAPEKPTYHSREDRFCAPASVSSDPVRMEQVCAGTASVEELVSQLSVNELADLCVGTFRSGDADIIGNASEAVPGAAGETSSVIHTTHGVRGLVLADGPAGLRLTPHFSVDGINYYQYTTAIPIGWALAQSWNSRLLEQAGSVVGTEMEEYGVDIWLAPALNIHRNPLCGRNFEYFSEDPYVSGMAAASICAGVQRHPGKAVCIKHFACNNQEDNRNYTNANVSERALREIYLKGFEIAVKQSRPMTVMSSYNLVNGEHTANSFDLIQGILRDEWGFDGFVMTDWFATLFMESIAGDHTLVYPPSASCGCAAAGNDVQMPGSRKNKEDLIASVSEGKAIDGYRCSLDDLRFCAANLLRVIERIERA